MITLENFNNFMKKLATLFLILTSCSFAFAPVPTHAASLIVCGEDTNGDGQIRNYFSNGKVVAEECNFEHLIELVNRIIDFIIYVIILPGSIVLFMYAGFLYMTSAVNPAQRNKAKSIFWNVLKGLGIALVSWLVVKFLVLGLGANENTVLWLLR